MSTPPSAELKGRVRTVVKIRPEDLTDEQRAMSDCIGEEAYGRLVEKYGGQSIYIPKADSVVRSARDEMICAEFNGYNYKYLCMKYNLSERTIRAITADKNRELTSAPLEGQVSFFDEPDAEKK